MPPLHLTRCWWAQCSTPRPEQSKLPLIPLPVLSARPPSLPLPSPLQSQPVSVLELDLFGSQMTKPAPLVLVLVPCPQQCHSELEQGVVFPDLLQKASLVHVGFCQGQFHGLELPLQLWHLLELQETGREQGRSLQGKGKPKLLG